MEVDFLDAAAKIVIELDGHYYFQSLDNYRRDRRKGISHLIREGWSYHVVEYRMRTVRPRPPA